MADVSYSVEIAYFSKGNLSGFAGGALSSLDTVDKRLGGLRRTTQKIGDELGSNLIRGAAMFVAADVLESAAHGFWDAMKVGIIEMNAELEQFGHTLALGMAGHGVGSFNQALDASSELIQRMRVDAQQLPGTFTDLRKIMTGVLGPGLGAGMSTSEVEQLASRFMASGVSAGLRPDVIGRELGALLHGQMRSNMPILRVMPSFAMDSKTFNALPIAKRVEELQKQAGMGDPASKESKAFKSLLEAAEHSWEGLTSTLKDHVREVLGNMTYHLFNRIKGSLEDINSWYSSNAPRITRWAKDVGWYMAQGFSFAVNEFRRIEPMLLRVGKFLSHEAQQGKLGGDLAHLAAVYAGLSVAGRMAPLAGRFAPEIVSGAGSALGGIGAGIGASGGLATLAGLGIVLTAVAAAAFTVYGAFEGITNIASPLHDIMLGLWVDIKDSAIDAAVSIERSFANVWPALKRLSEVLGTVFLYSLGNTIEILGEVAAAIELLTIALKGLFDVAVEELRKWGNLAMPGAGLGDKMADGIRDFFKDDVHKLLTGPEEEHRRRNDKLLDLHPTPDVPNHTTHIHNVEIKVEGQSDPRRTALETQKVLIDLGKRSSPYLRPYQRP